MKQKWSVVFLSSRVDSWAFLKLTSFIRFFFSLLYFFTEWVASLYWNPTNAGSCVGNVFWKELAKNWQIGLCFFLITFHRVICLHVAFIPTSNTDSWFLNTSPLSFLLNITFYQSALMGSWRDCVPCPRPFFWALDVLDMFGFVFRIFFLWFFLLK